MPKYSLTEEQYLEVLRLANRYQRQAEICRENGAYLASCVTIGAAFEAMLLAFVNCYCVQARRSKNAPRQGAVVNRSRSGLSQNSCQL